MVQLTLGSGTAAGQVSNLSQVSLKLRPGTSFVEVAGGERVAGVRVDASMRFALRPDLYGTDVFYAASMAIFAGKDKVSLPIENYLLCVLNPDAAVLCTWDAGRDGARVSISPGQAESGNSRPWTLVFPTRLDMARLGVGLLEAPGICRSEDLADTAAKFPENEVVSLQPAWTAPFPARWYTLICHDERPGAIPVSICLSRPGRWPAEFCAGKLEIWAKSGSCGQRTTASTNRTVAAWYDGKTVGPGPGKALRAVQHRVELPNGRVAQTPDSALTVIDLLREMAPETWEQSLGHQGPGAAGKVPRRGEDGHGPLCRAL